MMPQNVTSATSADWIQVKSIMISSLDFVQLVIICKHITEIKLAAYCSHIYTKILGIESQIYPLLSTNATL